MSGFLRSRRGCMPMAHLGRSTSSVARVGHAGSLLFIELQRVRPGTFHSRHVHEADAPFPSPLQSHPARDVGSCCGQWSMGYGSHAQPTWLMDQLEGPQDKEDSGMHVQAIEKNDASESKTQEPLKATSQQMWIDLLSVRVPRGEVR